MNRSFREQESRMPAVVNKRSSMVKEKEEELALFLEVRKREKEQDDLFLQNSEDFGDPLGMYLTCSC